eukprot:2830578-Alexandrium_andersonii.AAC.1
MWEVIGGPNRSAVFRSSDWWVSNLSRLTYLHLGLPLFTSGRRGNCDSWMSNGPAHRSRLPVVMGAKGRGTNPQARPGTRATSLGSHGHGQPGRATFKQSRRVDG